MSRADAARKRGLPSIASGGAAVAVSKVVRQGAQLIIFVAGARTLGPADFGVFALVSAFAALASVLAQGGWGGFIMSWRGPEQAIRQVLTIALAAGLFIALLGGGVAQISATLWSAQVRDLILLFSAWIFIAANAEAQGAVLVHRRKLVAGAFCQIAGECFGAAIALWQLVEGAGVFALAYGRIGAQSLELALAIAFSRTLPAPWINRRLLGEVIAFSGHMVSTRFISYSRDSAATFLVGGFLGAASVGYFRAGQRIVSSISEIISEPVRMIAWVLFRKVGQDHPDLDGAGARAAFQRTLQRLAPVMFLIAAPIYVGLAITAEEVLAILLGDAWRPAAPITAVLALAIMLLTPTAVTEPLLSVAGKVRFLPRVSLIYSTASVALTSVAVTISIMAVAIAQLVMGAVGIGAMVWIHHAALGIDWRPIARHCLFIVPAVAAMGAAAAIVKGATSGADMAPVMQLAVIASAAAAVYAGAIAALRPEVLGLFREIIGAQLSQSRKGR